MAKIMCPCNPKLGASYVAMLRTLRSIYIAAVLQQEEPVRERTATGAFRFHLKIYRQHASKSSSKNPLRGHHCFQPRRYVERNVYEIKRFLGSKLRVDRAVLHRVYGDLCLRHKRLPSREWLTCKSPQTMARGSERRGNIEGRVIHWLGVCRANAGFETMIHMNARKGHV